MQNAIELETLTLKDPLGELFNGWAKFQLLPRETLTQKPWLLSFYVLNIVFVEFMWILCDLYFYKVRYLE